MTDVRVNLILGTSGVLADVAGKSSYKAVALGRPSYGGMKQKSS